MDNNDLCTAYWNALGAFDYPAASKISTRLSRLHQPFSAILVKLTNCESIYTQLSFLKPKWFMRKDAFLGSLYSYLADDIQREIPALESNTYTQLPDTNELLTALHALRELCRVRQTLISIYQGVAAQTTMAHETILDELDSLRNDTSFDYERMKLLGQARQAITDYAFQDACMSLFQCKQELGKWKSLCQSQDYIDKSIVPAQHAGPTSSWRAVLFGSTKQGDSWPHHVRWHTKYFENLTAKMTLYFTNILLPRERMLTEDDPEKSLWKGIKIDYHEQICTFRKRFGPHSIGLVYEVTPKVPFYPQGYVCSGTSYEAPQGIHSFPFIYCQPEKAPKEHLPNIISIIQGRRSKLNDPKAGPIHFFDASISSTYYLSRIDEHAVLVVIYLDRHNNIEPATATFMNNLSTSLRGTGVINDMVRME
ncbi:hypothetical protein BCR43DRAFT_529730 [Syncephalastrum racemosum]|uniref:Uncharacterized protein n=1 Tax=Syncephalastrum racemosum TaxID=13706 RepID=A0A1X2HNX3_SYNRA|nr:hypothetical protein BCR43DRAFT_529730 [Syncephalastrum racemosum]